MTSSPRTSTPATAYVPVLPENAPFTPEQRAYLNGFLAGLFSRSAVPGASAVPAPTPTLTPLTILFGSQTGTAEKLAKRIAKDASKKGFAPTLMDLAQFSPSQLAQTERALILTSTYGDGEPPDNAKAFWDSLRNTTPLSLKNLTYSLLALGDSNYAKFCGFGRELDDRLKALGATPCVPRTECDVDYEEPYLQWSQQSLSQLSSSVPSSQPSLAVENRHDDAEAEPAEPRYHKKNPFPARLVTHRCLNAPGSGKEVRHFEIDLSASDLTYEVGDALGVFPKNDPVLVQQVLSALRCPQDATLENALIQEYDITKIPKALLAALAAQTGDPLLQKLSAPDANGELTRYLWGRDVLDVLLAYPQARFEPAEFLGLLKKIQPRLYSISSSPKAHPGQVHLTVGVVRFENLNRTRQGVCSSWLASRVDTQTPVPVFVHQNPAFRPPQDDAPLIMVGPGTGIAPFRAFLEERRARQATGKNWLFFGDQRSATDFLYREEIEQFRQQGVLHRLDLAWSRDQSEKVYVQHRMLENAAELYRWLEEGGSFCVCGDATRMARDVDGALHQVIEKAGGRSPEQAAEYVNKLKAQKRYLRDVY